MLVCTNGVLGENIYVSCFWVEYVTSLLVCVCMCVYVCVAHPRQSLFLEKMSRLGGTRTHETPYSRQSALPVHVLYMCMFVRSY